MAIISMMTRRPAAVCFEATSHKWFIQMNDSLFQMSMNVSRQPCWEKICAPPNLTHSVSILRGLSHVIVSPGTPLSKDSVCVSLFHLKGLIIMNSLHAAISLRYQDFIVLKLVYCFYHGLLLFVLMWFLSSRTCTHIVT